MNFGSAYDHFEDGDEWRVVRTQSWQYNPLARRSH